MNRNSMKKSQGFTLIELIIVIIILGILAVTAAPKFIDIQGDARGATLDGVKAAIQGANVMVYAKSALSGVEKSAAADNKTVDVNGQTVNVVFGYPKGLIADLQKVLDVDTADWDYVQGLTTGTAAAPTGTNVVGISPKNIAPSFDEATDGCYVTYKESADKNTPPVVTVVSGGC